MIIYVMQAVEAKDFTLAVTELVLMDKNKITRLLMQPGCYYLQAATLRSCVCWSPRRDMKIARGSQEYNMSGTKEANCRKRLKKKGCESEHEGHLSLTEARDQECCKKEMHQEDLQIVSTPSKCPNQPSPEPWRVAETCCRFVTVRVANPSSVEEDLPNIAQSVTELQAMITGFRTRLAKTFQHMCNAKLQAMVTGFGTRLVKTFQQMWNAIKVDLATYSAVLGVSQSEASPGAETACRQDRKQTEVIECQVSSGAVGQVTKEELQDKQPEMLQALRPGAEVDLRADATDCRSGCSTSKTCFTAECHPFPFQGYARESEGSARKRAASSLWEALLVATRAKSCDPVHLRLRSNVAQGPVASATAAVGSLR